MSEDSTEYTRKEIEELAAKGDVAELKSRLGKRIEFGTAGLRGPMRAGYNSMNNLTVQQASQGLTVYVQQEDPNCRTRGVVVGYDHRHHSREFAEWTAATFLSKGIKVYLYRETVPTPFVPYALLQLGCVAGIMITASHNPKNDNGYKLYWDNGAQIIDPRDRDISTQIELNSQPWFRDPHAILAKGTEDGLLLNPIDQAERYFAKVASSVFYAAPRGPQPLPSITYTAMHGVGGKWIARAFEVCGLPAFVRTPEQFDPDPEFPTVAFPNPEEGKGALHLAITAADRSKSRVIIANDPDADRLAAAEVLPEGGWKVFTGNEIGALLAWWVWTNFRRIHPDVPADKCLMANSSVSSKFMRAFTQKEGIHYVETLSGFKWLGNIGDRLRQAHGYTYLFAFEEAIGNMVGDMCLDKDGVRGGVAFAEMTHFLYSNGLSCQDQLSRLYAEYGYFESFNSYVFCYEPAKMDGVFERMRGFPNVYPESCGSFAVQSVCDPQRGFDSGQPDQKSLLPKASRMLTFRFANGAIATIRGSGTEPKFKRYIEMTGTDPSLVHSTLIELNQAILDHWIQPKENGFLPPSE